MNSPDVALVFPPGWTPFSPYLALPCLKAYLEERDLSVAIQDANLDFFLEVLTPSWLFAALSRCQEHLAKYNARTSLAPLEHAHFRRVVRALLLSRSIDHVDNAVSVFRSDAFFDLEQYSLAKQTLIDCLEIASASFPSAAIGFAEIRVGPRSQFDPSLLEDPQRNPFLAFAGKWAKSLGGLSSGSVLGLSVTSESQLLSALTMLQVAQPLRSHGVHFTLGGNYITRLASDWSVSNKMMKLVDSIILFEGEVALYQLTAAVRNGRNVHEVPGVLCETGDGLLARRPTQTEDIRSLPTPNFSGFLLKEYLMPRPIIPVYTSRSCFAKCTFCTIPFSSGGTYRALPAERVFEHMRVLAERHQVTMFDLVDETVPLATMRGLARLIKSSGLKYRWYCETRFAPQYTRSVCEELFAGGCRKLQFGLESYSQRVLDLMRKQIRLDWIPSTLESCMEAGIAVHLFFMVGFPGETREEAESTVKFTENCLSRAKRIFGNPHWTRGWGQFSLERHSDVFNRPAHYGVRLVDTPSEWVVNAIPYETSVGMSAAEAGAVVVATRRLVHRMLEGTGRFAFHTHGFNLNSEEESFLRICWPEFSGDQVAMPEGPVQRQIPSGPGEAITLLVRHAFLGSLTPSGPFMVSYQPDTKHIWESDAGKPRGEPEARWVLLAGQLGDAYAYDVTSGRRIALDHVSFLFLGALREAGNFRAALHRVRSMHGARELSEHHARTLVRRALAAGLLERRRHATARGGNAHGAKEEQGRRRARTGRSRGASRDCRRSSETRSALGGQDDDSRK